MITDKYQNSFNFKFELVSTDQVINFIDEIDCNKSYTRQKADILGKIKDSKRRNRRANKKLHK